MAPSLLAWATRRAALDSSFNNTTANGGLATDWAGRGGPQPDWANQIGNQGQQVTNFENPAGYDHGSAVTLDNGNILVAGTTGNGQFGLARYVVDPGQSDDGNLDPNFGSSGVVTTTFAAGNATATAVAMDSADACIVVAGVVVDSNGHNEVAIARYNDADGSLDWNFAPDSSGMVTTDLGTGWTSTNAVVVSGSGDIYVAGTYNGQFALLHFDYYGDFDTSFGGTSNGIVLTSFGGTNETPSAMTLSGSRILVAGTTTQSGTGEDFALAKYNSTGTLYTSFGTGGKVTTDFGGDDQATSLALQSNGQILVAGQTTQGGSSSFALARYNTNGGLDTNFGNSGKTTTSFGDGTDRATGVAIQGDGLIVVSGVTQLNGSGTNDGHDHFALARYNIDGTPDGNFGTVGNGTVTTDFSTLGFQSEDSSGMIVDTNGRLIVAGTATSSDSSYSSFAIPCYDPGTSRLPIQTQYDPPVMRIVVPDQATSGSLSLPTLAMFSCDIDPNTGSGYSYSIDWGDGSAPSGGTPTVGSPLAGSSLYVGSFGGSHTYTDPGVYYVLATVTAPGTGGSSTATMQVTVDSTTSLLTTSLPDASVNAGETYTLPNIAFTGLGIHTATVNWGDGTTDNATVVEPYMDDTLMATVPGSLTDSHIYSTSGSYPVTVTLTDDSGNTLAQPSPLNFTATVTAANVPLTSVSAAGNWLQVQYNVANAGSAPFPINIYSSTDGTTPDQLLTSYTVGGANGNDLTVGDHTALIAPLAGTPSGDYYLIASADSGAATSNNNTLALSGGTSFNAPQIIDTGNLGYADSGNGTLLSAGFTNTEQLLPANTGNATWQFTNLPTATYSYYDVYVTWSPQSNDNVLPGAALYTVSDVNGTQLNPIGQGSIAAVDQTIAPADDQANGTFWQHLGVFQVATGTTLQVQLTGNASPFLPMPFGWFRTTQPRRGT